MPSAVRLDENPEKNIFMHKGNNITKELQSMQVD